jgi:hypothetical protein
MLNPDKKKKFGQKSVQSAGVAVITGGINMTFGFLKYGKEPAAVAVENMSPADHHIAEIRAVAVYKTVIISIVIRVKHVKCITGRIEIGNVVPASETAAIRTVKDYLTSGYDIVKFKIG